MLAQASNPAPGTQTYECTVMKGQGKKGILRPDANGYYTVVLGGMDVFNTKQGFYDANLTGDILSTCELFKSRISAGNLYGEMGHPRREPGMTDDEFLYRVHDVLESNISHHIAKVWYDRDNYTDRKTGQKMVAFVGKVKPDGKWEQTLIDRLENPDQDCCFSVRCSSADKFAGGRILKKITKIITWDTVVSPGIPNASKYGSLSMESDTLERMTMSAEMLARVISNAKKGTGLNLESDYRDAVIKDLQSLLESCSTGGRSRSW
jgi:hypothetical protein